MTLGMRDLFQSFNPRPSMTNAADIAVKPNVCFAEAHFHLRPAKRRRCPALQIEWPKHGPNKVAQTWPKQAEHMTKLHKKTRNKYDVSSTSLAENPVISDWLFLSFTMFHLNRQLLLVHPGEQGFNHLRLDHRLNSRIPLVRSMIRSFGH